MPTLWTFDNIEDKHTLNLGKDCMKKFCEYLRKHPKSKLILKRKKCYR